MRFNSCPLCAHANPVTAAACKACGVGMVATCAHCGVVNDTRSSRCKRCDAVLPAGEADMAVHVDETVSAAPPALRLRLHRDLSLELQWPDGEGGVTNRTIPPPVAVQGQAEPAWITLDTERAEPAGRAAAAPPRAVLPGALDVAQGAAASRHAALPQAPAKERERAPSRRPVPGRSRWPATAVMCSLAATLGAAGLVLVVSRSPGALTRLVQTYSLLTQQAAPKTAPPTSQQTEAIREPQRASPPAPTLPIAADAVPAAVTAAAPVAPSSAAQLTASAASALAPRRVRRIPATAPEDSNGTGEASAAPAAPQALPTTAPPPASEPKGEDPP